MMARTCGTSFEELSEGDGIAFRAPSHLQVKRVTFHNRESQSAAVLSPFHDSLTHTKRVKFGGEILAALWPREPREPRERGGQASRPAHVSHVSHVSGGQMSRPAHVNHVSHVSGGVRRAGRPR